MKYKTFELGKVLRVGYGLDPDWEPLYNFGVDFLYCKGGCAGYRYSAQLNLGKLHLHLDFRGVEEGV